MVFILFWRYDKRLQGKGSETKNYTSENRSCLLMSELKCEEIIIHSGTWEKLCIFSNAIMIIWVPGDGQSRR